MTRARFIAGLTISAGAAACASLNLAAAPAEVDHFQLARDAADYRGRIVRTCGKIYRPRFKDSDEVWALTKPIPTGHHATIVSVVPCPTIRPVPSSGGKCLTGRIATFDGSLVLPKSPVVEVVSSSPISNPWYLHEQCPASRR